MRRYLRPLLVDRHSNPEIVRMVTFAGAVACLLVFAESSIHYAIVAGHDYDPGKIGELMNKFSEAFAWIIAAGAGGIAARSMTDKQPDNVPEKPPCHEGEVR